MCREDEIEDIFVGCAAATAAADDDDDDDEAAAEDDDDDDDDDEAAAAVDDDDDEAATGQCGTGTGTGASGKTPGLSVTSLSHPPSPLSTNGRGGNGAPQILSPPSSSPPSSLYPPHRDDPSSPTICLRLRFTWFSL